jgi:RNA recognition motif-containing protein
MYLQQQNYTKTKISNKDQLVDACNNQPMRYKIFLGCVPGYATEDIIYHLFTNYGIICEVNLRYRFTDGKCAGFGYLICRDEQTYKNILDQNGILFDGRKIVTTPFLDQGQDVFAKRTDLNKRKLLVKNIDSSINTVEFENYFSTFGKIEISFIVRSKFQKEIAVHGFVIFKDEASAQRAVLANNILHGRVLRCKIQKTKKKMNLNKDILAEENHEHNLGNSKDKLAVLQFNHSKIDTYGFNIVSEYQRKYKFKGEEIKLSQTNTLKKIMNFDLNVSISKRHIIRNLIIKPITAKSKSIKTSTMKSKHK